MAGEKTSLELLVEKLRQTDDITIRDRDAICADASEHYSGMNELKDEFPGITQEQACAAIDGQISQFAVEAEKLELQATVMQHISSAIRGEGDSLSDFLSNFESGIIPNIEFLSDAEIKEAVAQAYTAAAPFIPEDMKTGTVPDAASFAGRLRGEYDETVSERDQICTDAQEHYSGIASGQLNEEYGISQEAACAAIDQQIKIATGAESIELKTAMLRARAEAVRGNFSTIESLPEMIETGKKNGIQFLPESDVRAEAQTALNASLPYLPKDSDLLSK